MKAPCDCCRGPSVLTPFETGNRPGLAKIQYRVGTHGTFFATMQSLLSSERFFKAARKRMTHEGPLELAGLKTRDRNDPAIALLDAWSIVGDVLTFYRERIANEGYLRTATERRSVLELARLVGYTLRPGVASSVYLAYSIEKDSAPVEIPKGARVNTVPGPGEEMQAFETSEPLKARVEWNELKPRMSRPQTADTIHDDQGLYLKGIATRLKPNDAMIVIDPSDKTPPPNPLRLRRVAAVDADVPNDRTRVSLQPEKPHAPPPKKKLIDAIWERADPVRSGVSAERETAKRVVRIMTELAARSDAAPEELVRHLQEVALPALETELQNAPERTHAKLAPWISGIIGELRQLDSAGTQPAQVSVAAAATAVERVPLTISTLLDSLKAAPSEVPANASKLPRQVEQVFAPGGDTVPRLVTHLAPGLEHFYSAWRNLAVGEDLGIFILALRVQASLFGHNAPLRPILDGENRVTGHEEWLLADLAETSIALTLQGNTPESMTVEIKEGDKAYSSASMSLVHPTIADPEIIKVKLGPTATATVTVHRADRVIMGIEVNFQPSNRNVELTPRSDSKPTFVVFTHGEASSIPKPTREAVEWKRVFEADGATIAIESIQGFITGSSENISIVETALTSKDIVDLDAVYEGIVPQSWVAIERPGATEPLVATILEVRTVSKAAYGITGKFTRLKLDHQDWLLNSDRSLSVIRGTTVSVLSERLPLAEAPIIDDVCGGEIEFGPLYEGLDAGRWVIFSGERTDIKDAGKPLEGVMATELQMIAGVDQRQEVQVGGKRIDQPGGKAHSFIRLSAELAYCYRRQTLRIYGNVVKATHGETRNEVLGSGDAAKALQQFVLKQSPLTYVSAPTPAGIESSLKVRVNDLEWHEVDSLAGLGPEERKFVTETGDDGKTAVVFGNGRSGARLPTGQENVKATYRSGIGKPGNVKERQISLLATRPLGVKGVINPLRASGGADKEGRDQARKNAPLAVTSLDRLVSVQDHADFARTFAGIGKASAVARSDGRRETVYLTIAGADDIPIEKNSDLLRNLRTALHRYGDPMLPIRLQVRERLALVLAARVRLEPDYLWEAVEPKIRAALLDAFGFDNLEIGQDLFASTAISVIQAVRGVAYADLDVFDAISESDLVDGLQRGEAAKLGLKDRIAVSLGAGAAQGKEAAAQIAYLAPDVADTLILQEIRS